MAFRPSFLPQFKNEKPKKRPFKNGSVYDEYAKVTSTQPAEENPDLDELLTIRKKKAGRAYRVSILRTVTTLLMIGVFLWALISTLTAQA